MGALTGSAKKDDKDEKKNNDKEPGIGYIHYELGNGNNPLDLLLVLAFARTTNK